MTRFGTANNAHYAMAFDDFAVPTNFLY